MFRAPGCELPSRNTDMIAPSLRADCAQCAALCCVALAFDRSAHFAFDKKAGEPCPNLDANCRCGIHKSLLASGFRGCADYDCHGAGQYVTQRLFGGRSWRDEPRLLRPMMKAFAEIRAIHEMRLLVAAALKLALPRAEQETLKDSFAALLNPAGGWTLGEIESGAARALVANIRRYFPKLRDHVQPGPCPYQ